MDLNPETNERVRKLLKEKRELFDYSVSTGSVYNYGLNCMALKYEKFRKEELYKIDPCTRDYQVNPFLYQYDMEVECFIKYNAIVKAEIDFIRRRFDSRPASDEAGRENDRFAISFTKEYGTGIPREQHFWNAVSLRWPTKTLPNGAIQGGLVREPWAEDFIKALVDYEYVTCFGGSGQGKTHRALAFSCVVWDHFIDTYQGARCRFSTVNESKMKDSTWPYLQRIYKESRQGISLYCGRGLISGEFTIRRPNDKKGGGTIAGILITNRSDNSVVDKITGAHGHDVGHYHIDELQSTPDAPIKASPNFLQGCLHGGWITASGNYDLPSDSLGKNTVPLLGWDNTDEFTHIYEAINILGINTCCIHYNNDLSPGMTDEDGAKKWPFLPNEKKKNHRYPTPQSRTTDDYRRFWKGWRPKEKVDDAVVNKHLLRSMRCDGVTVFNHDYPVTHGWAFDTAPADADRNILTHFADGICAETGNWKAHIYQCISLPKSPDPLVYVRTTCDAILDYSKKWNVKSGNGITDWTNISGIPEELARRGFNTKTIVYHQSVPDGKKIDPRSGLILPAILIDPGSETEKPKYAHNEVKDMISLGAYMFQQMILYGQVTGLHQGIVNEYNSQRSFDEEICLRKFIIVDTDKSGRLLKLEPKDGKNKTKGFRDIYGFSPDILDTFFQMAIHLLLNRGLKPGLKNKISGKSEYSGREQDDQFVVSLANLYDDCW